jgi:lysophospholipase L1-like esterase
VALTFLALGDSYTIAEGVAPSEQWPVHLVRLLRAEKVDIADPRVVAKTGWTTDELADVIDSEKIAGTWSIVSLLIGVNNQYRGRPAEQFRGEFRELLETAVRFAGRKATRVLVLSIPDWGVMPVGEKANRPRIATEIDAYNAVVKAEAVRAGARFVDVTPTSRAHPEWHASDGLHPSGEQYAEWARLALPSARAALAS